MLVEGFAVPAFCGGVENLKPRHKMLVELSIQGIALIDKVDIEFGSGMTVITGETGAGKSVLVGALGLLRGGRARPETVRDGEKDTKETRVEAVFDLPEGHPCRETLQAGGREVDEGVLVRRAFSRNGRGRIHLGGAMATAGELAQTIGPVVDITSQHDQQSLMDAESQRRILDRFADNGDLLADMARAHGAWVQAKRALDAFRTDAQVRAEREDLLRFQLQEIEALDPQPGEDVALQLERERMRNAEKFAAAVELARASLYEGEGLPPTKWPR